MTFCRDNIVVVLFVLIFVVLVIILLASVVSVFGLFVLDFVFDLVVCHITILVGLNMVGAVLLKEQLVCLSKAKDNVGLTKEYEVLKADIATPKNT